MIGFIQSGPKKKKKDKTTSLTRSSSTICWTCMTTVLSSPAVLWLKWQGARSLLGTHRFTNKPSLDHLWCHAELRRLESELSEPDWTTRGSLIQLCSTHENRCPKMSLPNPATRPSSHDPHGPLFSFVLSVVHSLSLFWPELTQIYQFLPKA